MISGEWWKATIQLPSRTWHSSEGSTTHHARGPILDPFTLAVQINETFMAHTAAPARNCTPISWEVYTNLRCWLFVTLKKYTKGNCNVNSRFCTPITQSCTVSGHGGLIVCYTHTQASTLWQTWIGKKKKKARLNVIGNDQQPVQLNQIQQTR